MSTIWYYIDSTGQQVGPISADAIREALRLHGASPSSSCWREGMVNWQPISVMAAELGLPPAPDAPAPPTGPQDPYRPPLHPGTPEHYTGSGDIVYAGFLRRWAALFLDQLILMLPIWVVAVGLAVMLGVGMNSQGAAVAAQVLIYVVYFLAAPLYYALQESSAAQATLGKRALGIKVTDENGRRLSFGHALGRWFAAALSYLTIYIGFLMAAFTDRKRALHDMVASTLVVDKWAYTAFPERQKRSLSGCLIAFLIMMLMVPVIAIFAAIAISQYQDYVIRSQVSEASSLADGVKTAVGEYVNNRSDFPPSNADAGLVVPASIAGAYVSYVDVGRTPGRIEAGFSSQAPQRANAALDGKHLNFDAQVRDNSIVWTCNSDDLKQKYCPSSCTCAG